MAIIHQITLIVIAVVVLVTVIVEAQVTFPNDPSVCPHGRCVHIRACPIVLKTFRLNPPIICRYEGLYPIVCCPGSTGGPSPVQDISPPSVNFQCGISPQISTGPPISGPPSFAAVARKKRQIVRPSVNPGRNPALIPAPKVPRPQTTDTDIFALVGGINSQKNAWPWMALIGNQDSQGRINWFCAGVLINEQWVLSAAHCFHSIQPNVIRLGEHDRTNNNDGANPVDFRVAEIRSYPEYKRTQAYHDLALIRLNGRVRLHRFISPVCLPWGFESDVDITNFKVTLTGWGDTEFGGNSSPVLQEVDLTVFPTSRCDQNYRRNLGFDQSWPQGMGDETVCAGDPKGGKDACQGDSGGPIVSISSRGRYILAGIVSRGYGCGLPDFPGIYANARFSPYLAWIKSIAF